MRRASRDDQDDFHYNNGGVDFANVLYIRITKPNQENFTQIEIDPFKYSEDMPFETNFVVEIENINREFMQELVPIKDLNEFRNLALQEIINPKIRDAEQKRRKNMEYDDEIPF